MRGGLLRDRVARFERRWIVRTLRATRHSITDAARALGITRPTLYDRIKLYNITRKETTT